jgi:hypothetical protein
MLNFYYREAAQASAMLFGTVRGLPFSLDPNNPWPAEQARPDCHIDGCSWCALEWIGPSSWPNGVRRGMGW